MLLQVPPKVAFHSRIFPSFPADDNTVPVTFHSTRVTAELEEKVSKRPPFFLERDRLMIVKRANIRGLPSRIPTWTKPELVVLRGYQLPYPYVAISPTRRDEMVSSTTRRCPGHRRYRGCRLFFRIGLASRR